jgi:hypothetical protein
MIGARRDPARDGRVRTSSSSLDCVLAMSPTAIPSRPKRFAIARPRFGPAPTITIDIGQAY